MDFEKDKAIKDVEEFKQMGDETFYTKEALKTRKLLMSHPGIQAAINVYWRTYHREMVRGGREGGRRERCVWGGSSPLAKTHPAGNANLTHPLTPS